MEELSKSFGHSNPYSLAYQSRVGPEEWIKPYTEEVLEQLGNEGLKDLVVVPISFVSEHIETLQEIDMEYRELARKFGIINFHRVPALGTYPLFIKGLADLVSDCLEGPEIGLEEAAKLPTTIKIYPQEKWQWGWNNSSEVWNGRVAMYLVLIVMLELISGNGPLHLMGLL